MVPKRQTTILTIPGTFDVPLPPLNSAWSVHPVARYLFWEKVRENPIEVGTLYENKGFDGGVQAFKTPFSRPGGGAWDHHPSYVCVKNASRAGEVPFCTVKFEAKLHWHHLFNS